MNVTLPYTTKSVPLETLTEDASARELFGLLPSLGPAAAPLVAYLGLFRPTKQGLRWSRALTLALEVLERANADGVSQLALAGALSETVESLRAKRQAPGWKPLTSHNYLWQVISSRAVDSTPSVAHTASGAPRSRTAQIADELAALGAPEGVAPWFARAIYNGFSDLLVAGCDGVPAYDVLPRVAQQWAAELWPKREWVEGCRFRGAERLRLAFRQLADGRRWPSQGELLGLIPRV